MKMKKKATHTPAASLAENRPANTFTYWFDYFFPLLPFAALIPNFFILPGLTYSGLATQEVGFAVAVLLCAIINLLQIRAAGNLNGAVNISRKTLWIFAPLGLFILWQTLSLLWSVERGEAWRQIGFWFGFLVFLSALWNGLRARAAWWVFYTLFFFAAALALSLWLEYRTYGADDMLGIFFNHGQTAELLATLFPLFFCVFLFEKNRRPAVVAGAVGGVFTLLALFLTLRRTPLLGAGAAFVLVMGTLFIGQMKAAYRWRVIVVVFGLLLFGLPLLVVKRDAISSRLQGAFELQTAVNSESMDLGLTGRATLWLTALEMGKANWLKGVGIGNYAARYATYRRNFVENPRYAEVVAKAETEDYDQIRSPLAHSEYLQLFAELGIVGVVLYALFWLQVLHFLWQARRTKRGHLAFGVFCSLIALGVSAASYPFAFRLTPGIFTVAGLLAMACAALSDKDSDKADDNIATDFTLPRSAVLALGAFAVAVSLLLLVRNYRVYESQRMQGSARMETQLDFSFALDNAPANEASVRRYEKVLASDPYNAGAHLGLSILLFQMKRLPECLQHADYALQHGYNRPFTYLLRAFAHEHGTSADKAQEVLREGIASFPKSIILRTAYAELLRKRGHPEEVESQQAELEKQKLDPNFVKSWALVMRYKDDDATRLAKANGLTPPGELKPTLARVLAQARAYHYFRSTAPAP
jgi:O-antigen ligase